MTADTTIADRLIDSTSGVDLVELLRSEQNTHAIRDALEQIAGPDLEVNLYGPDAVLQQGFGGVEGFISAWRDWTQPFSEFSWTPQSGTLRRGDLMINFVEQRGVIAGTTNEVTAQSAAIWHFSDNRLVRIDFHLDREMALRSFEELA